MASPDLPRTKQNRTNYMLITKTGLEVPSRRRGNTNPSHHLYWMYLLITTAPKALNLRAHTLWGQAQAQVNYGRPRIPRSRHDPAVSQSPGAAPLPQDAHREAEKWAHKNTHTWAHHTITGPGTTKSGGVHDVLGCLFMQMACWT